MSVLVDAGERTMIWCEEHRRPHSVCRGLLYRGFRFRGSAMDCEKCRPVPGRFVPDDHGPTIASLANDPKARD